MILSLSSFNEVIDFLRLLRMHGPASSPHVVLVIFRGLLIPERWWHSDDRVSLQPNITVFL